VLSHVAKIKKVRPRPLLTNPSEFFETYFPIFTQRDSLIKFCQLCSLFSLSSSGSTSILFIFSFEQCLKNTGKKEIRNHLCPKNHWNSSVSSPSFHSFLQFNSSENLCTTRVVQKHRIIRLKIHHLLPPKNYIQCILHQTEMSNYHSLYHII